LSSNDTRRYIFILDEYEQLFGKIDAEVSRNPHVKHDVALPLFRQMLDFSRNNLLVFLGLAPDAHYILMDLNPLSSYVHQDSFPLFEGTEFTEFLQRVMHAAELDASFVHEVYEETAGHPWLTVQLMVILVDWLIDERRSLKNLKLTAEDFTAFARKNLNASTIGLHNEFNYFDSSVSKTGTLRRDSPWLWANYRVLARLGQQPTLTCSRADFPHLFASVVPEELGFNADHILKTGSAANLLRYDSSVVTPKINLLARIFGRVGVR